MTALGPDTIVVLLTDHRLVRGPEARAALLVPDSFICAWRCSPDARCWAPDGVRCDCPGAAAGHDPGDEDRSSP